MKPSTLLTFASFLCNLLLIALTAVFAPLWAAVIVGVGASHLCGMWLQEIHDREEQQEKDDNIIRKISDEIESQEQASARHIDYPHG